MEHAHFFSFSDGWDDNEVDDDTEDGEEHVNDHNNTTFIEIRHGTFEEKIEIAASLSENILVQNGLKMFHIHFLLFIVKQRGKRKLRLSRVET